MQIITVPKEVIWVTRLLWMWLIITIAVNYTLSGIFKIEALLIHLMVALPIVALIWVINYFLKKANKWVMWIFVIVLVLVVLLDISTLLFPELLTTEELEGMPSRTIRILFGLPIVYLLLKQKNIEY
jgi:hypothetical protein